MPSSAYTRINSHLLFGDQLKKKEHVSLKKTKKTQKKIFLTHDLWPLTPKKRVPKVLGMKLIVQ